MGSRNVHRLNKLHYGHFLINKRAEQNVYRMKRGICNVQEKKGKRTSRVKYGGMVMITKTIKIVKIVPTLTIIEVIMNSIMEGSNKITHPI